MQPRMAELGRIVSTHVLPPQVLPELLDPIVLAPPDVELRVLLALLVVARICKAYVMDTLAQLMDLIQEPSERSLCPFAIDRRYVDVENAE